MKKIKELFNTPKKAVISSVCLIFALCMVVVGGILAADNLAESSSIGTENAQNFAFADAKVDPADARNVFTEFEFEQGQFVYDVEFTAGGVKYEYGVKADDGSIVKKKMEIIDPSVLKNPDGGAEPEETLPETASITLEEAKEAALKDAGLSGEDVTFTKTKKDKEGGIEIYEIEFVTEDTEYEYEIRAVEGTVYSRSKESIVKAPQASESSQSGGTAQESSQSGGSASQPTQPQPLVQTDTGNGSAQSSAPQTSTRTYIGVDQAKAIAAGHIGASVADLNFTKAKLEEDARENEYEYEIEFYVGNMGYEFSIDAITGNILDYECEGDDDYDDDWDDDDWDGHHWDDDGHHDHDRHHDYD